MRFKVNNGGVVVADLAFMQANYAPGSYQLDEYQDEEVPAMSKRITKLAFRNRFTTNEKTAMELAATHDHGQAKNAAANLMAASIRATMADQRDATYIDLDRADTIAGVQGLEAGGLLAAGRAAVILGAPIQPHEIYHGS
jgi:hypothetical protein